MTSERIKEIQSETAYPESVSVQQALLKVWAECELYQLSEFKHWWNDLPDESDDRLYITQETLKKFLNR